MKLIKEELISNTLEKIVDNMNIKENNSIDISESFIPHKVRVVNNFFEFFQDENFINSLEDYGLFVFNSFAPEHIKYMGLFDEMKSQFGLKFNQPLVIQRESLILSYYLMSFKGAFQDQLTLSTFQKNSLETLGYNINSLSKSFDIYKTMFFYDELVEEYKQKLLKDFFNKKPIFLTEINIQLNNGKTIYDPEKQVFIRENKHYRVTSKMEYSLSDVVEYRYRVKKQLQTMVLEY